MVKKIQTREDELDGEEKIILPDVIVGDEEVEETDEDDDALDLKEMDPFGDKWEE